MTAVSVLGRIGIHSTAPTRLQVVAHRTDVHEAHATLGHGSQPGAHPVIARAAGRDLGVLQRHPAERDEQLRVLGQYRKRGMRSIAVVHVRDDVRHQRSPGAQAVAIHAAHVAAQEVQEAVQLTDGVMKTPRAGPAVRAAENRAIAVLGRARARARLRRAAWRLPNRPRRMVRFHAARCSYQDRARASFGARPGAECASV